MAAYPPNAYPPNVVNGAPVQQSMTAGLDFTAGVDGLFVAKQLELLEMFSGCETKNRYNVTLVPKGLPDPLPKEFLKQFKDTSQYQPLIKAKEESACMERLCCPNLRSFKMPFIDGQNTTFFSLERPFRCTCMSPCCMINPQTMYLKNASGALVAQAVEEFKCCWLCTRSFAAQDASGKTLFHVRAAECGSSRGCNMFAPSCCNERYSLDVYDANETAVVTVGESIFPGCNCKGFSGATNYMMRFPEQSNVEERAALLAAYFLIEFVVFEWKQNEDK